MLICMHIHKRTNAKKARSQPQTHSTSDTHANAQKTYASYLHGVEGMEGQHGANVKHNLIVLVSREDGLLALGQR